MVCYGRINRPHEVAQALRGTSIWVKSTPNSLHTAPAECSAPFKFFLTTQPKISSPFDLFCGITWAIGFPFLPLAAPDMKSSQNHPSAECIMNEDKPRSCSAGDKNSAAQQVSGADSAANEAKRNDGGEDLLIDPPEKHQAAPDSDKTKKADELYSAHTVWQKRLIVSLGASVGWFSTSSSFIFFPIIPFLARDLRESTERINLTVTSYLVASGVFPSIVAGLSDVYGRKPVFVTALGAYVAVNIGLALQRSFAVLLGLRLLQAAAISGKYSICLAILILHNQKLILIWPLYK